MNCLFSSNKILVLCLEYTMMVLHTGSFHDLKIQSLLKKKLQVSNFRKDAKVFAPLIHQREGLDIFHTSFEELYQYKSLDSLTGNDVMFSPALISTVNDIKIAVTESDLLDYPGMFLKGTGAFALEGEFAPYPIKEKIAEGDYPQMVVTERADYMAKTNGSRNFPWRVLMIARNDKELPANDIVYRLAYTFKTKRCFMDSSRQMHRRMDH